MITEFLDTSDDLAHDRFQGWRTSHQEGVFLTLLTRMRANLHGARCRHLGSGPPYFSSEDGFGSLTSKKKICAPESELYTWAATHEITVTRCQHCVRDGLVGAIGQVPTASANSLIGNKPTEEDFASADEIADARPLTEGAVKQVLVNAYERNPEARRQCIKHYGFKCIVCDFDFGAEYGDTLRGYIHAHHLKPLSEIGASYVVDPILDMRPVCPNCHAVLHRRMPPYTIEEVRGLLDINRAV